MSILLKLVSAMEKCFMDEPFSSKKEKTRSSALLGEEVCFEAAYTSDDPAESPKAWLNLSVSSPLAEFVRVRQVEQVPVRLSLVRRLLPPQNSRSLPRPSPRPRTG